MSGYEQPVEAEWVVPVTEGYKMACCDCGLVHRLDFRVVDPGQAVDGYEPSDFSRPAFRVFRDNRATGQIRRHMPKSERQDR